MRPRISVRHRHPELVSGPMSPPCGSVSADRLTLKQFQGDVILIQGDVFSIQGDVFIHWGVN